jgi:hypothetical protein
MAIFQHERVLMGFTVDCERERCIMMSKQSFKGQNARGLRGQRPCRGLPRGMQTSKDPDHVNCLV